MAESWRGELQEIVDDLPPIDAKEESGYDETADANYDKLPFMKFTTEDEAEFIDYLAACDSIDQILADQNQDPTS